MSGWIRSIVFCTFGLAALLLTSSSAAAQVRVGVAIGAPFVAAPIVVAPGRRVMAQSRGTIRRLGQSVLLRSLRLRLA